MAPPSTADGDTPPQRTPAPGRFTVAGRPLTLVIVVGVFVLSGLLHLLAGDSTIHASGGAASWLAGFLLLAVAAGLWNREQWSIVAAGALQALGLLFARLSLDFPGIVVSIVLLGTMLAIPRQVWR